MVHMIAGIDPGLSGAVATLEVLKSGKYVVDVVDMPTLTLTIGGKQRQRLDMAALFAIIADLKFAGVELLCIEDLAGRPATVINSKGQRIAQKGQFEQGWNACAPVMAAYGAGIRHELVTPSKWKPALDVPRDKDGARLTACRIFPDQADLFKRLKDDGRAEAVLLALYARNRMSRALL
jgi:crossover junction endodeoxyribonuclease RuvC